ncbi:MAG: glycosylase [Azospirillum brasilense]|nr:MAG: glycosylase [Azospirillum brasilense]
MAPWQWEKRGLVFDVQALPNRPEWFDAFAQAPNAIVLDDRVRVYFCCRPKADATGMFVSYGAYVDLDRRDLTRIIGMAEQPIMELGGLGMFDEFGTYPISTIKDGTDVYAYFGGWTRGTSVPFNVSIGVAKSSDGGVRFDKLGTGPVLGHALDEPFVVTSPKIRKYGDTWWLIYTAGMQWFMHDGRAEIVYKLRAAHSPDGLHWTRLGHNLLPDKLGPDEAQACGDVLFHGGRYHMFYCYREATNFRHAKDRTYRIGYAHSDDMRHWTRDDSKAGIDVSAEGWDSDMVAYPHVFALDGEIYMLYLGNEVGRAGFGLAQLKGTLA